jgi:ABC-type uncharacterized transport system permease subunit
MTLFVLRELFGRIFTYSSVPVIMIGLYRWSSLSKAFKALLIGLIVYAGLIFFSLLTVEWRWKNNIFLNYILTSNDAIFMTFFYFTIIKSKNIKKGILIGGVFCVLLSLLDAFWITGYRNNNSISGSIETFFVLCINVFCLSKLIKTHEGGLLVNALFWANAAIFLNNSFPIFQQLFNEQLYLYSTDLFSQFDIFVKSMLIIANIFYALAFWYAKPKTQTL